MYVKGVLLGACVFLSSGALAQLAAIDPDWKEKDIPPPPPFEAARVVDLEMPRHMAVKVGIDPDTVRVTTDGVVRYVAVARAPGGSVQASYEGIRCFTGDVKVYARAGGNGNWSPVPDPQWKPLRANQPSLHALAFARQAACEGQGAATSSPATIIAKLKSPALEQMRR